MDEEDFLIKKRLAREGYDVSGQATGDVNLGDFSDSTLRKHENLDNIVSQTHLRKTPERQFKEYVSAEKQARQEKRMAKIQRANMIGLEIGANFRGTLSGEPNLKLLPPAKLGKKGIIIDFSGCPFLSNQDAVKNSISKGLKKVTQGVQVDVSTDRQSIYADADSPGSTFKDYGSPEAYYSSGMIPVWRGNLIGSFKVMQEEHRLLHTLKFTSPYAGILEMGGTAMSQPPDQWFEDKDVKKGTLTFINAHPFVGSVAMKIENHLETFGYLQLFADTFVEDFK